MSDDTGSRPDTSAYRAGMAMLRRGAEDGVELVRLHADEAAALLTAIRALHAERDEADLALDEALAQRNVLQKHLGDAIKAAGGETAADGAAIVKVLIDRACPEGSVCVDREKLREYVAHDVPCKRDCGHSECEALVVVLEALNSAAGAATQGEGAK